MPSHIEQELRRRWRERGYSEETSTGLLALFCKLADIEVSERKKKIAEKLKIKDAA